MRKAPGGGDSDRSRPLPERLLLLLPVPLLLLAFASFEGPFLAAVDPGPGIARKAPGGGDSDRSRPAPERLLVPLLLAELLAEVGEVSFALDGAAVAATGAAEAELACGFAFPPLLPCATAVVGDASTGVFGEGSSLKAPLVGGGDRERPRMAVLFAPLL